jgi:xanthine/uracil permease
VATVANFNAYLVSVDWNWGIFSDVSWSILMIGLATIIYVLLINYRNLREAALVGIWAFIGIAVRQYGTNPAITWMAIGASFVLFICAGSQAYKNRKTLPLVRRWFERKSH